MSVQLITDFLSYLQYERRMSLNTVNSYQNDLNQFVAYLNENFKGVSLLSLSPDVVRSWMVHLVENGITSRSVSRKLSALRALYRYLMKRKLVENSPVEIINAPKSSKRLPQFVEENEMEQLFDLSLFENTFEGWRDRLVLELFYATGIRLSELTHLTFSDIDLYESQIKVLGKRNKQRIIPFGPRLSQVITTYFAFFEGKYGAINKNCCIFVDSKMKAIYPKAIYRIVRKYLDMVTVIDKRSPHVLRHTFATHMLNRGADINAIKEILGHSSLAATQVYTHNSIEKLKNIYNQAHPRA